MLLKLASARQKAFDIEIRRGLADGPLTDPLTDPEVAVELMKRFNADGRTW